jgi:hypothetical protein
MRAFAFYLFLGISFSLAVISAPANPLCARTPELALRTRQSGFSQGEGYRVASMRWDPLLNQHWAMIASCSHPERPAFALRISDGESASESRAAQTPFPVVHAGDVVQLWSQEHNLRIEAAGRAEESAAAGGRVRVRLLHTGFDPGQEQTMIGIVRGAGDVEILR